MANEFAAVHAELVAAQSEVYGSSCVATIGTQTVAAVIYENGFQDVIADGGVAIGGTQMVAINKALLTDFSDENNGEPPKGTEATVRGLVGEVLDVNERDGIFYITIGSFATE